MSVDLKTSKALDLRTLKLPAYPEVLSIHAEDYTDSDGDEALRVTVVLAEDTDLDKVTGENVRKLKSAIHQSLIAEGIARYPYVFIEIKGEPEAEGA